MSSPVRPFLAVSSNLAMLAKVCIRKTNYRYNCDFLVSVSQPGPCDLLGEPQVMFEEATSRPLLALFSTFFVSLNLCVSLVEQGPGLLNISARAPPTTEG